MLQTTNKPNWKWNRNKSVCVCCHSTKAASSNSHSRGCLSVPASGSCLSLPPNSPSLWGLFCTRWLTCGGPAQHLHKVNIYSIVNVMLLSSEGRIWGNVSDADSSDWTSFHFFYFQIRLHIRDTPINCIAEISIIGMWIYAHYSRLAYWFTVFVFLVGHITGHCTYF